MKTSIKIYIIEVPSCRFSAASRCKNVLFGGVPESKNVYVCVCIRVSFCIVLFVVLFYVKCINGL